MAKKPVKAATVSTAIADKRVANAKMRLVRHLKKHAGDEQAAQALAAVGSRNFRKKPVSKNGWAKESLRVAMTFVPFLNGKGQPIPVKSSEQLGLLLRNPACTQTVPQTKANLRAFAQMIKFTTKTVQHSFTKAAKVAA